MKKLLNVCIVLFPALFAPAMLWSQCGPATTQSELNWDHLEFLPSNNIRYTDFYPDASFPYTQHFAMGTRRVTFTMAPQANITLNGENTTNTAHGSSPEVSNGADVQFTTTTSNPSTITIRFDEDVQNLRFSLFDLDNSQRVRITATNGAGTAQAVTMTRATGGASIITLGGTATNPTATANNTNCLNNNANGSLNIVIAGPVREVVIALDNAAGDIWLSDIDACVSGTFPTGYRAVSRPFTGQPQYVLTVVNNNIYYTDPESGRSYFLFNEPDHNRLNSMAYDPYRRRVYYTFSLSGGNRPRNDKTVRVYDVDSKTISILIPDVNEFGIPTYESGVESGAASFYNGSLYLGVEGYTNADYAASRKSTIWKIDFDGDGNPIKPATQVWGILADNGVNAQNIHDWSDFAVVDGKLIDFDGSGSGDIDYFHFDLMTGVQTEYTPVGDVPRQVSVGWDEKIYNVDNFIALYNGTNAMGTKYTITAPLGPTIPTGSAASWGDAAGPYRPFLDFGDAPATYDPDPWSPACHDTLTPTVSGSRRRMVLGNDIDVEWLKRGFTTVEDNYEDGLSFVPILSPVTGYYSVRVRAFNNTNLPARIVAWLDFNGNAVFDPEEGITPILVPSSNIPQEFDLVWSGIPEILIPGEYTYLRIRITRSTYNMTQNHPTGYYDMGEVEDYRVVVDNGVLPIHLINFDLKYREDHTVAIKWEAEEELNFPGYELQRSADGYNWELIHFIPGNGKAGLQTHQYIDANPLPGKSWYRLRIRQVGTKEKYGPVKWVNTASAFDNSINIFPNPVVKELRFQLLAERTGNAALQIVDMGGKVHYTGTHKLAPGNNQVHIPETEALASGVYLLHISINDRQQTQRFVIRH